MTAANSRHRLAVFGLIAAVMALSLALVAPAGASAAEPTVTIEPEGSGEGTVECEVNEEAPEPCEGVEEFETGDEVNLYAEAEEGSEFIEFGGSCGPLACELGELEEGNYIVTVLFEAEPVYVGLNILSVGNGFGEVECEVEGGGAEECQDEYLEGTELNLVAEAEEGSEFVEWEGECDSISGNECEVEMSEEKTVEVVFDLEPELFKLNIEPQGNGTGEVICETEEGPEECQEEYPAGTDVYLIAQAEPGSEFVEWEGECDSIAGNECEVEMERRKDGRTGLQPRRRRIPADRLLGQPQPRHDAGRHRGDDHRHQPDRRRRSQIRHDRRGLRRHRRHLQGRKLDRSQSDHPGPCGRRSRRHGQDPGRYLGDRPDDKYTFETPASPPTVSSVSPNHGTTLGGTVVTITGTNLTGAEEVKFGATAVVCAGTVATCKVESSTEVKATTPAHAAEEVDVTVKTPGGTSATGPNDKYTFETPASPPTVSSVSPNHGTTLGGTVVTITGTNLTGAEEVKFGTTAVVCAGTVATCKVESSTEVKATTPAHVAEEVDLTVKTPGGTSATGPNDKYTFETPATTYKLTVTKTGSGSGTVTSNPAGISCGGTCEAEFAEEEVVGLFVSPASGSEFVKWTGACTGSGACQVTMDEAKSVGVEFAIESEEEEKEEEESGGGGGGGGGNSGGGGSSSGGGSTPPPAPTPTAQPLIANPVIAVKGNKAQIKVKCRGDEGARCRGVAKLIAKVKQHGKKKNLTIGKTSFNLPTGSSLRVIRAKLTGQGVKLVKKAGNKGLAATISGNGVRSRSVKLKLQGGNKKHKRSHRRNHRRH